MKIELMVSTANNKLIGFLLITIFLFHLPAMPVTGQAIHYHTDYVNVVAWNGDGTYLASGSTDTRIILWNDAGEFQTFKDSTIGPNGSVLDIAWDPHDPTQFFSGDVNKNVLGWNTSDLLTPNYIFDRHNGYVTSVAVDPRSNSTNPYIVSGGKGSNVRYYVFTNNIDDPAIDYIPIKAINDHESGSKITGIDFAPDGSLFATSDSNGNIRLYSVPTLGAEPSSYASLQLNEPVEKIRFNAGGDTLIVMTSSQIRTYRVASFALAEYGTPVDFTCSSSCLNYDLEISPDQSKIAIAADTKFEVYSFNNATSLLTGGLTSTPTFTLDTASDLSLPAGTKAVSVSWHPDNSQLALAAGPDVIDWDTTTNKEVFRINGTLPKESNTFFVVGVVIFLLIIAAIIARWAFKRKSI